MTIHIIVAEDHPVMREGIKAILQEDEDLVVIGEAYDGEQAFVMCYELRPDLLLLDLRLPKMSGLTVARALSLMQQPPRIVILSAYSDPALVSSALEAGVSGYILKTAGITDLVSALHRVMQGQKVLLGVDEPLTGSSTPLSSKELEVIDSAAHGLTTKEIARQLHCSESTVETYFKRIYLKVGAHKRAEAVAIVQRDHSLS